ncbi:transmembrane protein 230-like isoform X1 [Argonauta hians]
MSRRFFGGGGSARYQKLSKSEDGDFVDMQFEKPPVKIPYKAIGLATTLFTAGTLLISIGALLFTGHISSEYSDRMWPLLILGSLMFIPGSYHVMIAYYAYKGYDGYSFDDIPDFD